MNRSKKRRQSERLTVSLFPFLAVLICTLGILIVLLVISVQSASVEADTRTAASQAKQQQQLTDVLERGELMEFEAQNVESVRADVSQRLAISKSDRSYLQRQINDLESEARLVYLQYRELQKRRDQKSNLVDEGLVTRTELDQLSESVARVQRQIDQKRAEVPQVAATTNFQIVPYSGGGGTARRPIYIECDANGLTLQPLDIRLGKSDFVDPNRIGNVLDSALLAIREYYQKHGLADDETKPYPLLIVRPEGAWAYSLARRAMKSWDDEFGYELVDRDTPLEFGSSDALLEEEIRATIETAHRRQLAIVSRSRSGRTRFGTAWRDGRGSSGQASAAGYIPTSADTSSDDRLQQASHEERGSFSASYAGGTEATYQAANASRSAGGLESSSNSANGRPIDGTNAGGPGGQGQFGVAPASASESRASAEAESIAQTRGANWALPSQTTGARPYVRPIRVGCSREQLHILSQNQIVATIELGASTKDSVDALVSEIWKTIDRWGIAGQNAFWKPELRFSILPGGQQRFEDLQVLLDQSGLIVEVSK